MAFWQEVLNLQDWRIESAGECKRAMASVEFDDSARLATYRLGDFGASPINTKTLSATALHECLHILLRDLIQAINHRGDVEAQEHRIVNVLEKILMRGSHETAMQ